MLPTLRAKRDRLKIELAACEERPNVIALHPGAMAQYPTSVDRLAASLVEHAASDDRGDLVRNFRTLVHSVTVHTRPESKDLEVEVKRKRAAQIGGNVFTDKVGGAW